MVTNGAKPMSGTKLVLCIIVALIAFSSIVVIAPVCFCAAAFTGASTLTAAVAAKAAKEQAAVAVVTAEEQVQHLLDLRAEAEAAKVHLARFQVRQARFYFSEDRFSSDPVIDLTVWNGTGQTVSRFYCRGVLSSPGRTPWVEENFNYSVRGGIQTGETRQFKLSPSMFSEWCEAPKDRDDLVLSVTVYRLDGPDGEELFPFTFSEDDAARLAALVAEIRKHDPSKTDTRAKMNAKARVQADARAKARMEEKANLRYVVKEDTYLMRIYVKTEFQDLPIEKQNEICQASLNHMTKIKAYKAQGFLVFKDKTMIGRYKNRTYICCE